MNTGLTLSETIPYITRHTDSGLTGLTWSILWLSGPPGIGKSDLMRQFCRQKGYGLKVVYMATRSNYYGKTAFDRGGCSGSRVAHCDLTGAEGYGTGN